MDINKMISQLVKNPVDVVHVRQQAKRLEPMTLRELQSAQVDYINQGDGASVALCQQMINDMTHVKPPSNDGMPHLTAEERGVIESNLENIKSLRRMTSDESEDAEYLDGLTEEFNKQLTPPEHEQETETNDIFE